MDRGPQPQSCAAIKARTITVRTGKVARGDTVEGENSGNDWARARRRYRTGGARRSRAAVFRHLQLTPAVRAPISLGAQPLAHSSFSNFTVINDPIGPILAIETLPHPSRARFRFFRPKLTRLISTTS